MERTLTALFFALISCSSYSAVIVHDEFGDGALGTNPGTGSGFTSSGQDPALESGGNAILATSTQNATTVQIESNDTFDAFLSSTTTRSTWSLANASQGTPPIRTYVGLQDSTSNAPLSQFFIPLTTGAQGLYISIFQYSDQHIAGNSHNEGNLFALDHLGNRTHLAEWDWNSFSSLGNSGALDIILETDSAGYSLSFSQDIALISGSLTGDLSSLGTLSNSFQTGAFNQFLGNTLSIDSITVETVDQSVPIAGSYLLLLIGFAGMSALRWRCTATVVVRQRAHQIS